MELAALDGMQVKDAAQGLAARQSHRTGAEEARLLLLRHPDAGVGDGDARLAAGPFHGDDDLSALWRVLDGVGHQIHEHLLEALAVAFHQHRPTGTVETDVVGPGLRAEVGDHVVDQIVDLHVGGAEMQSARLQPGDVEQVLHQPAHPLDLPSRLGHQIRPHRLAPFHPALDALQVHGERRQRRPQLVCGDGEKVRPLPVQLAQLGHVGVDHQTAEILASGTADRSRVARQPAMRRPVQLDLVTGGPLAIGEDGANALQHRLGLLGDGLGNLLPVDVLEGLSVHGAQGDPEDLLDPVRCHAQQATCVEERDPVRVPIEDRT